jgi:hypothetical protein
MVNNRHIFFWIILLGWLVLLESCDKDDPQTNTQGSIQLNSVLVGTYALDLNSSTNNNRAPVDKPIVATFSMALNQNSVQSALTLKSKATGQVIPFEISYLNNNKTVSILPDQNLGSNDTYTLTISDELRGIDNQSFLGFTISFTTAPAQLSISSITIDGKPALNQERITNVPTENAIIEVIFSSPLDPSTITSQTILAGGNNLSIPLAVSLSDENKKLVVELNGKLDDLRRYQFAISANVKGAQGEEFQSYTRNFFSAPDGEQDFPLIPQEDLLTLVQQKSFEYFFDFAHPASGMARERNSSGDLVTSGGSGFGIMALIVGMEREFITKQEGLTRMDKILDFLATSDRFHGAWSHWINGNTGDVIPFSTNDNGGDLVETSFLVQGLITFRQYLDENNPEELELINRINELWHSVEWDWYTREGQDVLYWHWSPDKAWAMNHQIKGYNEALITYVLAAASPTHPIDADVYHKGWASNGGIISGKTFYNITLPVGFDYGGPLFFTHYSFLGLDPRNLSDQYANYWTQNVNHSLINHAHSVANPKKFVGYSDENWGLTASDNHVGYNAHSPTNDLGVISPTAALSSFPYTPEESMKALEFFYYNLGDRLWGLMDSMMLST